MAEVVLSSDDEDECFDAIGISEPATFGKGTTGLRGNQIKYRYQRMDMKHLLERNLKNWIK